MKRRQLIIFILDKSGSTARKVGDATVFEHEYKSVAEAINRLMKAGESSLELEYMVQLIAFNDSVQEITTHPMSPRELLQVLDSKAVGEPGGCTSIAAMYDYLDVHLTRNKGGWLEGIRKGDPLPIVFLLTDYCATDSADILKASASNLQQNNNYIHAKHLCLFLGEEKDKKDAENMFGADNVLNIEDDKLDLLLTPVIATSSVVAADCSRIGAKPKTNKEILKEQTEIAGRGEASAETWIAPDAGKELTDAELQRQIIEALGGMAS